MGGGYITILIKGDVAAVHAAIVAGKTRVPELGKLIAANVIPRPSESHSEAAWSGSTTKALGSAQVG